MKSLNEKDNGNREEWEVSDWDGFGNKYYAQYMSESDFDEVINAKEIVENSQFPVEVIELWMSETRESDIETAVNNMKDAFYGQWDSLKDWAYDQVEEGIFTADSISSHIYVTDTDKRILSNEEADHYVGDMDFNEALEKADMEDEFNTRQEELEEKVSDLEEKMSNTEELMNDSEGDDYDRASELLVELEEERDSAQEEVDSLEDDMNDEVREKAREVYYDEIYDRLENDLDGYLSEMGYEKPTDASFVSIDYEAVGEEYSADFKKVYYDGEYYMFSDNYEKGGRVIDLSKPMKKYKFFVLDMTQKKIVSGHKTKSEAQEHRKEIISKYPKRRFSVYPTKTVKEKYNLDTETMKDFIDIKRISKLAPPKEIKIKKIKNNVIESEYTSLASLINDRIKHLEGILKRTFGEDRNEIKREIKELKSNLRKLSRKQYLKTGSFALGGTIREVGKRGVSGVRRGRNAIQRHWEEADFGDGTGKAEFMAGGIASQLVFLDGSKLARIKEVSTSKRGAERYTLTSPDGHTNLGRFNSHRVTMADRGALLHGELPQKYKAMKTLFRNDDVNDSDPAFIWGNNYELVHESKDDIFLIDEQGKHHKVGSFTDMSKGWITNFKPIYTWDNAQAVKLIGSDTTHYYTVGGNYIVFPPIVEDGMEFEKYWSVFRLDEGKPVTLYDGKGNRKLNSKEEVLDVINNDFVSYAGGGETKKGDVVFIEFLNKDKGFQKDEKGFSSYEEAVEWGQNNLENFNRDMIDYYKDGGSTDDGVEIQARLINVLKDSGFNHVTGTPENEYKHNSRNIIAIVGKDNVGANVYLSNYTPNTHRFLGSTSFDNPQKLAEYFDKNQIYSSGGSTYAEGGTISTFSDFKNKVVVKFVEKENGNYVTEVLHYPSGELKDKSIPTKVKSLASISYIKKLGRHTDGVLSEGSFTEWIKENKFNEKQLKMLKDIAKQYNVKMPIISSTYAEGGEIYSTLAYSTKKEAEKSAKEIEEYFKERVVSSEVKFGTDEKGKRGYQVYYELKKSVSTYNDGGELKDVKVYNIEDESIPEKVATMFFDYPTRKVLDNAGNYIFGWMLIEDEKGTIYLVHDLPANLDNFISEITSDEVWIDQTVYKLGGSTYAEGGEIKTIPLEKYLYPYTSAVYNTPQGSALHQFVNIPRNTGADKKLREKFGEKPKGLFVQLGDSEYFYLTYNEVGNKFQVTNSTRGYISKGGSTFAGGGEIAHGDMVFVTSENDLIAEVVEMNSEEAQVEFINRRPSGGEKRATYPLSKLVYANYDWDKNEYFKMSNGGQLWNLEVRKTDNSPWEQVNKEPMTADEIDELRKQYENSGVKYYDLEAHLDLGFKNGGEVINDGGNYLLITATKNRMVLTLTPEGKEEVLEMREDGKDDSEIMSVLFEDIQANSELEWHYNLGDSGLGMTDASGVTDGYHYSDEGEGNYGYTTSHNDARLYYFNDYALRSEVDDLLDENREGLILTGADNRFDDGGSATEYDSKFDTLYSKYNAKDYWGVQDQIKTQLRNWNNALEKGDENAKKYTEQEIRDVVTENNKVRTYHGVYLPLKEAIERGDKSFLKDRVRYDQKFTKEAYEVITGKTLPNTNKELHTYFDSMYENGGEIHGYDIDNVLDHFLTAGLWASMDDNDDPLDGNYSNDDVSEESKEAIRIKIIEFVKEHGNILTKHGISEESLGHDLFLTSQGHGAGFWDRGYGDDGDILSEASEKYFSSDQPYVGDDGKVYFYGNGGQADLSINKVNVNTVLEEALEDATTDVTPDYELKKWTEEEVETESRDGFIPFTDGGTTFRAFTYLNYLYSSGYGLPTNSLDKEMNRQVEYSYELAKERFIEEYPEIVEELGEDNIDCNSLYEADYESEAEELSEWEMDMGDDSAMFELGAYYYNPNNSKSKDGKHTLYLFALVNLEAPYHRSGNLEDFRDVTFTFDSIEDLESKLSEELPKMIDWFNGGQYESNRELKIRTMKDGGETWIQDVDEGMEKKGTVGSFTKQAKDHGMTTVAFAKEVLANPDKYIKRTRHRAQFMKNVNPEKFK